MTERRFEGFAESFLWGAATSAYQIEGHSLADGAGANIWDQFTRLPGRVTNGDTGDIACDHYIRYRDDVKIMSQLGLTSYRFSIAWGRVLPQGRGRRVNKAGLGFYDRLIDTLLENGISPCATLYHWELPAALQEQGGWLNRDITHWFADYAQVVFEAFDDRVPLWATLNEPWVTMHFGYLLGEHAPGHRNAAEVPVVAHHQLLAHARSVSCYRAVGHHEIGIVVNLAPKYPASDQQADMDAAARSDAYMNRFFLDPLFTGEYPEEVQEMFGKDWPDIEPADMHDIQVPVDFIGINYYTRDIVRYASQDQPLNIENIRHATNAYTDIGWEVYPKGLHEVLCWVSQRYGRPPVYVMENGAAFDEPESVGDINEWVDMDRTSYFASHLKAAACALLDGVDLRGYFAWSLLDNFEWAFGYSKRFGLVHVDYSSQKRTVKSSGRYYRDVIRTRGSRLFEETEITQD